jgi:hypothetical protein
LTVPPDEEIKIEGAWEVTQTDLGNEILIINYTKRLTDTLEYPRKMHTLDVRDTEAYNSSCAAGWCWGSIFVLD